MNLDRPNDIIINNFEPNDLWHLCLSEKGFGFFLNPFLFITGLQNEKINI